MVDRNLELHAGRVRFRYYAESFRRKWAQWPALLFTVRWGAHWERGWWALLYIVRRAS